MTQRTIGNVIGDMKEKIMGKKELPEKLVQWQDDVNATLRFFIEKLPEQERIDAMQRFCGAKTASLPDKQTEKDEALAKRIAELEHELEAVKQRAGRDTRAADETRKELHKQNSELHVAFTDLTKRYEQAQDKAAQFKRDYEALKAQNIKDPEPARLEHELARLASPVRDIAAKYFDLERVHVFCVQCGQFSRITQCWEACVRSVLSETTAPQGMADFLYLLGGLYNKGSANAEARVLMAEVNTPYDYERHQRVGQDGTIIREVLLPGLENAAGKIVHKALVRLG